MARRGALALIVAVGVPVVAVRVAAQSSGPPPVTLEWEAPAECPSVGHVEDAIARLLAGGTPEEEKRVKARAVVFKTGVGGWHEDLSTQVGEESGQRALDATTCDALADATALVLALAVDPTRVARNQAASSASSSASTAPSASVSVAPVATASATPSSTSTSTSTSTSPPPPPPPPVATARHVATSHPPEASAPFPRGELAVAAFGVADSALLPHVAAGVGGALAWLPGPSRGEGPLRIELDGLFLPKQTSDATGTPPHAGNFGLLAFALRACPFILRGPLELAPCVAGELLFFSASGKDITNPSNQADTEAAVDLGGLFGLHLGGTWVLRLDAGAAIPFARPAFVVGGAGAGPVHKPAGVSARTGLGIELRF
jgi:hypothetical protein